MVRDWIIEMVYLDEGAIWARDQKCIGRSEINDIESLLSDGFVLPKISRRLRTIPKVDLTDTYFVRGTDPSPISSFDLCVNRLSSPR